MIYYRCAASAKKNSGYTLFVAMLFVFCLRLRADANVKPRLMREVVNRNN